MIDARRMEVYCSVLDYQLQEIETIQAKVIDANSFADLLNQHRVVFLETEHLSAGRPFNIQTQRF